MAKYCIVSPSSFIVLISNRIAVTLMKSIYLKGRKTKTKNYRQHNICHVPLVFSLESGAMERCWLGIYC